MSTPKNIFLTGEIRTGKSTLLKRAQRELNIRACGFATLPVNTGEEGRLFVLKSVDADVEVPTDAYIYTFDDTGTKKPFTHTFDHYGAQILSSCLTKRPQAIIMDELGIYEDGAREFQSQIFSCLSSDIPVMGVIKKKPSGFLDEIRRRPDVKIIDITPANRQKQYLVLRSLLEELFKYCQSRDMSSWIEATAIVLAGGKSRRMGTDKALLPLGGNTMLNLIVEELQEVFPEILISCQKDDTYRAQGTRRVYDIYEGSGPLAGLHAGLVEAKYPWVFCTACDMPFANAALAKFVVEQAQGFDIAVPKIRGRLEPLFAAYSKNCIPFIEEALKRDQRKVTDFFSEVRVKHLEETDLAVFGHNGDFFDNINTPTEYQRAKMRRM